MIIALHRSARQRGVVALRDGALRELEGRHARRYPASQIEDVTYIKFLLMAVMQSGMVFLMLTEEQ